MDREDDDPIEITQETKQSHPIEITHDIRQLLQLFFSQEDFAVIRSWCDDNITDDALFEEKIYRFRWWELDQKPEYNEEEETISLIFDQKFSDNQFFVIFNYSKVDIEGYFRGEWQIISTFYENSNDSDEVFRNLSNKLDRLYSELAGKPESKMPGYHLRF